LTTEGDQGGQAGEECKPTDVNAELAPSYEVDGQDSGEAITERRIDHEGSLNQGWNVRLSEVTRKRNEGERHNAKEQQPPKKP
jgi:hypothetical protein